MLSKIDVRKIISNHFNTLYIYSKSRISYGDYFLFFGMPLLISGIAIYYFNLNTSELPSDTIVNSLSIFTGLLLNVLVLFYTILDKLSATYANLSQTLKTTQADTAEAKSIISRCEKIEFRVEVLGEVFSNISFTILTAMTALVILIVIHKNQVETNPISCGNDTILSNIFKFGWFVEIALLLNFLLTLLMILKRTYVLIDDDIVKGLDK